MNTIHESHDHIPPKSAIILQLHRDLYKFESYNIGGKYKIADNVIEEEDSQGIKKYGLNQYRPGKHRKQWKNYAEHLKRQWQQEK